jgi:exodeoxyribonuclease V alpha subunit
MEEYRGYIRKTLTTLKSDDIVAEAQLEMLSGLVPTVVIGPFNKFVSEGDWFLASGVFRKREFRGREETQFHARVIRPDLPKSAAGALALFDKTFNPNEHGVDLESRRRFVERHGAMAAFKAEQNPDLLLEMTSDPSRFGRAIKTSWARRLNSLQPIRIMEKAGAGPELVSTVLRKFKDETLSIIRENPYALMALRQVDFRLADKMAEQLGFSKSDPRRVGAGVSEIVSRSLVDGHTYVPLKGIMASLEPLDIDIEALKRLIREVGTAEGARSLGVTIFESPVGKVVQRYDTYRNERDIARHLARLVALGRTLPRDQIDRVAERVLLQKKYAMLSDEQRDAVLNSSREAVAILTGGPGTGKSTVSEAIAEIASLTAKGPVLLTAPTGKAARRLSETTGKEAVTVHKLLGAKSEFGDFSHNAGNPLPAGCFVLVDESSMLDTSLARAILDALPPDGRILFVGDKDQLPSVDAGYVLGDMLAARTDDGVGVPSSELTKVFRSLGADSLIAPYAKEIKEGTFDVSKINTTPTGGVAFFEFRKESIAAQIKHLYCTLARKPLGLDPEKDVVILSPMRRGRGGTHELNRVIQEAENPRGGVIDGWFRPPGMDPEEPSPRLKDRVMFTKNDNDLNIRNGDVGVITDVVSVWDQKKRSTQAAIQVKLESGEIVTVPVSQAPYFTVLAYAITGHKSQGSQYKCVLMPMSPDHVSMLDRTLIYTEWTRAKRFVVMVGDKEVFAQGVDNVSSSRRQTLLKTHIEEELDALGLAPVRSRPTGRPPAFMTSQRPAFLDGPTFGAPDAEPEARARPAFLGGAAPFASPFRG